MKGRFLILAALLLAPLAHAQTYPIDMVLNWTNPTTYIDGVTPIPVDGLSVYDAWCVNDADGTTTAATPPTTSSGPGNPESVTIPAVITGPGTYTCYATVQSSIGIDSDQATDQIAVLQPNVVTGFSIAIIVP